MGLRLVVEGGRRLSFESRAVFAEPHREALKSHDICTSSDRVMRLSLQFMQASQPANPVLLVFPVNPESAG